MTSRKMLRSGQIDTDRFFTIDAALEAPAQFEAWLACFRITGKAGVGAMSETLRVDSTFDELQVWADGLSAEQIEELADKVCP